MDRRENLLMTENRKKAKDVDKQYVWVEEGQGVGLVKRKLGEYGGLHGLVVDTYSEASEDMNNLIQCMAESRVAAADLQRGQPGALGQ